MKYKPLMLRDEQYIQAENPYRKMLAEYEWSNFDKANPPIIWLGTPFEGTKTEEEIEMVWQYELSDVSQWVDMPGHFVVTKQDVERYYYRQAARPKEAVAPIPELTYNEQAVEDFMQQEMEEAKRDLKAVAPIEEKQEQPVQQEPCKTWKECINYEPRHCALGGCLKLEPLQQEGEEREEKPTQSTVKLFTTRDIVKTVSQGLRFKRFMKLLLTHKPKEIYCGGYSDKKPLFVITGYNRAKITYFCTSAADKTPRSDNGTNMYESLRFGGLDSAYFHLES